MTTEQMDWVDDERAGRHKPEGPDPDDARRALYDMGYHRDQAEGILSAITGKHAVHSDETTMAEEPIEDRLRRAWLNGFKEGVDRAAQSVQDWGRWDS